ncbi:hypothetical protein C1H46_039869 [Malus baccata]|uniref:Uncharacterized protein n=1 Tax=Malus baccata TaxID=106549 RepID=A0A540KK73_MALBA|nr:hypothetical protein C1H46_039869 [Malus baccata]
MACSLSPKMTQSRSPCQLARSTMTVIWVTTATPLPAIRLLRRHRVAQVLRHRFPNLPRLRRRRCFRHSACIGGFLSSVDLRRIEWTGLRWRFLRVRRSNFAASFGDAARGGLRSQRVEETC